MRAIWEFNFIDTARPALSSAGEVIFEPEDKRERDLLNSALDWPNSCALVSADMFVFITILTPSLSHPFRGFVLHGIPAVRRAFYSGAPHYSSRLFAAARRRFPTVLYRRFAEALELRNSPENLRKSCFLLSIRNLGSCPARTERISNSGRDPFSAGKVKVGER